MTALDYIATRLFQRGFLAWALFIPFSSPGETIAIGFTLLAIAVMFVYTHAYRNDQGRTLAVDTFATEQADRNVATRLVLWDMSWKMFLDHPLLGLCMGGYSREA